MSSKDTIGHSAWIKALGTRRIGLHNTGGLLLEAGTAKDARILGLFNQYKFDAMCIPEVNANWDAIPGRDSIWERTYEWFSK